MDCETALKQAITAGDPLQNLVHLFGNASLKNWLENGFGDELGKCLADNAERNKSFAQSRYLGIVDGIIPPVPNFIEDEDDTTALGGSLIQSDLDQIVDLIAQIIEPVIRICMYSGKNTCLSVEPLHSEVLLKTVYYASEDIIDSVEFSISSDELQPFCTESCHIAMALIIILGRKMSDDWFHKFIFPWRKIFFTMRMIVTGTEKTMCPYVKSLRNLYEELNLEEEFETRFPACKSLLETSHMFQEDRLVTTLKCIAQILHDSSNRIDFICGQQFLQSGLLHKFHTLLCKPSEIGDQTFVIKSFLTVFLSFETKTEDHYEWDSDLFEMLVDHVYDTLNTYLNMDEAREMYSEVHKSSPFSTIERLESEDILALELLEALHVLNSSWHQWFDIMEEDTIVGIGHFHELFLSLGKRHQKFENILWLVKFTKICPAMSPAKWRRYMFEEIIWKGENSSDDVKYFEVRRNNVLSDIFDIFSRNGDCIHYPWYFNIKDEIATGPGVTKEVYSLLSQELQKCVTGLWQGQPIKGSGNEMRFTYLKYGLVPNVTTETRNFKLLGMIMAKAILDEQLLDIPLSLEFFQRLRTIHLENYSHLKREYYDLMETFPMLESLYKQLLPVKRKIELIRSEVGLTKGQKREIMDNLTFDNGSSFDDLCLNFTVPGTDVELTEGGRDMILSPHNIDSYLEKLCAFRAQLNPVNQFKAIRKGIDKVLSPESIDLLLPKDLKALVCCDEFRRWTMNDLQSNCKYDNTQSVGFLFETLTSFDIESQGLFLKFVTGMTSLPFGGLGELNPPLTILTLNRDHADSSLPSAATCFNLLRLPEYSSLSVTREKLLYVIHEASNSFGVV